jgi:hypothetical protein
MATSLFTSSSPSKVKAPSLQPSDMLQDPLAQSQLPDDAISASPSNLATITRKTRLHLSSGADADGKPVINEAKPSLFSSGGTTGGNLAQGSEVNVDFDQLDASGEWAKSLNQKDAWLKLNKLQGAGPTDTFKKGDKFFGLVGDGKGRKGYTGQIKKSHALYDKDDKPQNYDFVNALAAHGGLSALQSGKGRDKQMADALAKSPKWKQVFDDPKNNDGIGSHVASQAALDANLETMEEDGQIRFLLDGMDMKEVLEGGKWSDAATSHELRYVYRNWDKFKGKVSFFKDEQRVPAPWLTDANLWAEKGHKKIHSDV